MSGACRSRGARGWTAVEFVDWGVPGSRDRRPALDAVLTSIKRRQFDVLVCWRLDRLGRSLKHLVTLLDELQALGVAFVSLAEGIDATTPAGKLQMHILATIAEFERARIAERVTAGLARARANGRRLGQKPLDIPTADLERTATSASDVPQPSWASLGRCCTGHGCPADLSGSWSRKANEIGPRSVAESVSREELLEGQLAGFICPRKPLGCPRDLPSRNQPRVPAERCPIKQGRSHMVNATT